MDVARESVADLFPEVTPEEARYLDHETLIVAERRLKVARLYRRGRSMKDIAAELKVNGTTITHDLQVILDGIRRQAARTMGEHIADALHRLAHREAELEDDLDRSRGELVEQSAGRRAAGGTSYDTTTVKKKQRYGDPRLHALLVKCWENRCRLLGLLKDQSQDPGKVPVKLVSGINPEELV